MNLIRNIINADNTISLWVARHRIPSHTTFLKLITYTATGRAWFIAAITIYLLNYYDIQIVSYQPDFLRALFAPLTAWIFGHAIKKYFRRKRPFQLINNFVPLVKSPVDDSFPSLHAASTFSFFTALLLSSHPFAYWVGLWAVLASYSRLYLGVHFLSDILGGIFLGIICGTIILSIV